MCVSIAPVTEAGIAHAPITTAGDNASAAVRIERRRHLQTMLRPARRAMSEKTEPRLAAPPPERLPERTRIPPHPAHAVPNPVVAGPAPADALRPPRVRYSATSTGAHTRRHAMTAPVALVWNENFHEQTNRTVRDIYPDGIHGCLADLLNNHGFNTRTATLDQPDAGLTDDSLDGVDVLLWWAHLKHDDVPDHAVQRVVRRVHQGMGLVVLHSAHMSKPFRQTLGATGALSWREAGERERLWVVNPAHPITHGLPPTFTIETEEMYGEPFGIPEPEHTLLISWFEGGEVFRSGATWTRGAGRVFYFRPGHETYPTYHHEIVRDVIVRGARWAADSLPHPDAHHCPNRPDPPEPFRTDNR